MYQARPGQDPDMGRERVVRDRKLTGNFACRKAVRALTNQEPEQGKPRRLRQSCQSKDRGFVVHMSRNIEI